MCGLVGGACWLLLPWIGPTTARQAWSVGILWTALTVAFEFLAGHYLFENSWERLLADYDVAAGRIWVLVPATTLAAPVIAHRARSAG